MNVQGKASTLDNIHTTNRKPSFAICCRLADNLKKLRTFCGYTQADLAARCGFHKNYVSNVEQATVNITLANLEALAKGLGCAEEDLLRVHIRN